MNSYTMPPLVRGLLIAVGLVWIAAEIRQGLAHRPEAKVADAGSRPVIRLSSVAGIVIAYAVVRHTSVGRIHSMATVSWVALVVLSCGVALRLWSFRTLGRYFTFTVQTSTDQPVIALGPYRVIRHPSYAGVLLAIFAVGLLFGNWLALMALVVPVFGGVVYRIQIEERALRRELGERYETFAQSRKRLVPFVW